MKAELMKSLIVVILLTVISQSAFSRFTEKMSYKQMEKYADLIVIAAPVVTADTNERGNMPGGPDWDVVGLSTEFDVSVVMKGEMELKKFVLHHYRQKNPKVVLRDGPNFAAFDPKDKKHFLLFLKKESDGRYAPVSGQLDPALYSILELNGHAK